MQNKNLIYSLHFLQPTVEKAQLHALHGDQLIQSNHYAVDSIRPKCVELRRVCDDFSNEAKKKSDILSKSLQIHMGIDKVKMHTIPRTLPNNYEVEGNNTSCTVYCQNYSLSVYVSVYRLTSGVSLVSTCWLPKL